MIVTFRWDLFNIDNFNFKANISKFDDCNPQLPKKFQPIKRFKKYEKLSDFATNLQKPKNKCFRAHLIIINHTLDLVDCNLFLGNCDSIICIRAAFGQFHNFIEFISRKNGFVYHFAARSRSFCLQTMIYQWVIALSSWIIWNINQCHSFVNVQKKYCTFHFQCNWSFKFK